MPDRFSFDGGLMFAFRAADSKRFPWIFALAFGFANTGAAALLWILSQGELFSALRMLEALEGMPEPETPDMVLQILWRIFEPLVPYLVLGVAISWAIWAMFETASQRRYMHDEGFYLRFGLDEINMMIVGLFWFLLQAILLSGPFLMFFSTLLEMFQGADTISNEEFAQRMLGTVGQILLMLLVLVPVYVFLATRLSACFALTVREGEIRFLDAWNVTNGRFWPILGGYVIIVIVGSIAISIAEQVLQFTLLPVVARGLDDVDSAGEFMRLVSSPSVVTVLAIYTFIRTSLSGLLMHVADGPAALAARYDPRGSNGVFD